MAVLCGWKEIANFLKRGVRTVQRWETLGLPVHRPQGGHRNAVIAFPEELDAWGHGTPMRFIGENDALKAKIQELTVEVESLRQQLSTQLRKQQELSRMGPASQKQVSSLRESS